MPLAARIALSAMPQVLHKDGRGYSKALGVKLSAVHTAARETQYMHVVPIRSESPERLLFQNGIHLIDGSKAAECVDV
jgi:hypothetical protein